MTREMKYGLLLVLGLTSVFGFMVYKRLHQPAGLSAGTGAESENAPAENSTADPFAAGVVTAGGVTEPEPVKDGVLRIADAKPASRATQPVAEDDPFAINAQPVARPVRIPARAAPVDDPFTSGTTAQPVKIPAQRAAPATLPNDDPFAPEVVGAPAAVVKRPALQANPSNAKPAAIRTLPALPVDLDAKDSGPSFGARRPGVVEHGASPVDRRISNAESADDPFTTPALTFPRKEASAVSTTVIERQPAERSGFGVRRSSLADDFSPNGDRRSSSAVYIVQPSDNYWVISKQVYGSGRYFEALRKHNETVVPDPQRMKPGVEIATPPADVLEARYPDLIPDAAATARSTASAAINSPDVYVAEAGDNFWIISKKVYGSGRYFQALAEHNRASVPDPLKMQAGTAVQTPPVDKLQAGYASILTGSRAIALATGKAPRPLGSDRDAGLEPVGFFVGSDDQPRFRVGAEDTLTGIAKAHLGRSSRWVQILEMNRDVIIDGNTLSVGTVLRLPTDASQVQAVVLERLGR